MIDFNFRGGIYKLYLNGYALFNFYDKFGREKGILETITADGKPGYEALIWLLCELSREGMLYSNFLGESGVQALQYQQTTLAVQPFELPAISAAVTAAVTEGFFNEHPDAELEEDEFLKEFEAQKKTRSRARNILRRLLGGSASASTKE